MLKYQAFKFIVIVGLGLFILRIFFVTNVVSKFSVQKVNAQEAYYGGNVSNAIFFADDKAEIVFTKATNKSGGSTVPLKKTIVFSGAIGKPGPIFARIKKVDGKRVCARKKDIVKKSKKNFKDHVDSECCLDPDEIPNSRCYYPQQRYAKAIQKYLKSGG